MLRAIIVDDEELSVKRLKRILSESGEFGVCHTFLNPLEAYEFMKTNQVDVAFLDISMPDINGMKLSNCLLDLDSSIQIVFVTGYDEYAVQAFEMNALDYLLKPVTVERVNKTLGKINKKQRAAAVEPILTALFFNGLKVYQGDQNEAHVKLRSPKTEELLAFLVYKGAVSREEIIDTLWNGLEPEKAGKNLNSTLYYIRKAISASKTEDCILAGRSEIRIDESGIHCDLYEFERLLKAIRLAPACRAELAELFKQAEALYTGPLLKGKSYDWASEKRRRIEQDYIELLELAARFYLEGHEAHLSLHYYSEILKLDALREDISYKLIRLYVELGRTHEAIREYRKLEELLQQELGMKPGLPMTELFMKLKH